MPDLALAPSASPPAATPGVAGNATAAADAGGETTQGSPFATLLQEHLAAHIPMTLPEIVGLPAAKPAAEAPADATETTADAMMMMLGMAAQPTIAGAGISGAAEVAKAAEADMAVDTPKIDNPQLLTADASAVVPLALPATAIQLGQAQQKVGAGGTPHDRASAATSATNATAILAAAADADKDGRSALAAGKADEAFTAIATENQGRGAESLPQVQTPQARAAEQAVRIDAPLGSRQWDGEFANRLAWMVGKQEQRAELVLTPPQLGRIEVSVSVNGEQATAIFTSASATVRDAIENALPRLREVLQESGINLGQTHVGSESPRQQSAGHEENRDNRGDALALGHDNHAMPPGFAENSSTAWLRSGRGMIDVFA